MGADDYFIKPFEPEDLFAAIRGKLKKQEPLQKRIKSLSAELDRLHNFIETKDGLLENFELEMRRFLANIKLTITILTQVESPELRQRYLDILQDEFNRQISILNQLSELKKILTPDNITLLSQFNMLHHR